MPTEETTVNIPTKVTDLEDGSQYIKSIRLNGNTTTPDSNGNADLGTLSVTFKVGDNSVVYNIANGATINLTDLINRYVESALLWKRTGTTLSPKIDGDNISTSGKIY